MTLLDIWSVRTSKGLAVRYLVTHSKLSWVTIGRNYGVYVGVRLLYFAKKCFAWGIAIQYCGLCLTGGANQRLRWRSVDC